MFPTRCFAHRFFTPRYFPPGVPDTRVPLLRIVLTWEPSVRFAFSPGDRSMPLKKTLRLIRGQDLILEGVMCPPHDMTGWSLAFTVRDSAGGTVVLGKTTPADIGIIDPGRGRVQIVLARGDTLPLTPTAALAAGKGYVWDLKRTDNGRNLVLALGQMLLEQEISV
jgi:hypothetical protein